jgi:non-canonical (house-cleaning) NTP pyrophosphatase
VKLDTQLFNRVLEQVRSKGPDAGVGIEDGTLDAYNLSYMDFINMATSYIVLNPTAAIASAFQIGMEVAFQYQKVSQEVKINQISKGESN